jgi:hypothetical protein
MSKSRLAPNQGVDFSWGLGAPRIKAASVGGLLFEDLILKGNAFRVVFLELGFSSVRGGENLDVLGIANLLACVDVDKNGHWSLFSFRLPQWVSLRSGLNIRTT